jgi:6-phosphogluconolactonase (cycloisomerase 2 family)
MPPKSKKLSNGSGNASGATDKGKSSVVSKAPPVAAVAAVPVQDDAEVKNVTGTGKPDQAEYHAEQDKIKAEIDSVQAKLVCLLYDFHNACVSPFSYRLRSRRRLA